MVLLGVKKDLFLFLINQTNDWLLVPDGTNSRHVVWYLEMILSDKLVTNVDDYYDASSPVY